MNVLEVTCSFKNTLVENLLSQGIGSHAIFMYCKTGEKNKQTKHVSHLRHARFFFVLCIMHRHSVLQEDDFDSEFLSVFLYNGSMLCVFSFMFLWDFCCTWTDRQ